MTYIHTCKSIIGISSAATPTPAGPYRHIFLLTDGAVGNTGEVIKLIDREVNKSIQCVHTIGMGSGADKHLVEGAAEAGFGTSALIADQKLVEEKVITAL